MNYAQAQVVDYSVDSIYEDNVYWKRLQTVSLTIKPFFDNQIQEEIKSLLRNPETPKALGKYFYYQDTIKSLLSGYGLPAEMENIPFCNTFMNIAYRSQNGETGCWPLPYYVGKKYGLVINSYIDERRDLYKSTEAAAKSLADLYHIYRDWYFTIAAFSSGPLEMNKAVRKAGNSLDYFVVEPYIAAQHRKTFSRFMASIYVINFYQEHQLQVVQYTLPILDTVCSQRSFSFGEIAEGANINYSDLVRFNPMYKKNEVLHKPVPHCFVVRKEDKSKYYSFIKKLEYQEEQKRIADSLAKVKKYYEKFQPDSTNYQIIVLDGKLTVLDSAGKVVDPDKPLIAEQAELETKNRWVYYTVKRGDALYLLADVFDCNLKDLKRWNKLRSNTIVRGQRLKILVPASKYSKYSSINRMSASQKQKLRRKD